MDPERPFPTASDASRTKKHSQVSERLKKISVFSNRSGPKRKFSKVELSNKGPKWGVRHVQALMMFFLLSIGYSMRTNLSIGIVAMTDNTTSSNPNVPTYDWNNKSTILSSFFVGYIMLQIWAGELGKKYGVKWFVTIAMVVNSVACIMTPFMAAWLGSYGVMACRVIQGMFQGFFFPSIHNILGRWAPQEERSTIGNMVFTGVAFGTIIALPATGLIAQSWVGWPVAFYTFGVIGLIWTIAWIIIGANSPAEHKTITFEERLYIETSLSTQREVIATPWKKLATSLPVWAILVANLGQNWGYAVTLTEIPNYLNKVCGKDMKQNTWLSAAPYALYFIMGLLFGPLADYWVVNNVYSRGTVRKIMNSIGVLTPAVALVILGIIPKEEVILSIVLLMISVASNSAVLAGFQVNHVDLSPKFSGVMMGMSNGLGALFMILSPMTVQWIVTDESDKSLWRTVFIISACFYISSDIFYMIFASGERQPWDYINEEPPQDFLDDISVNNKESKKSTKS